MNKSNYVEKIKTTVKIIKSDIKKMPKYIKILTPILFLLAILITAGCSGVGPSREYVNRQHENAMELFPIFDSLIDEVSDQSISNIAKLKTNDKKIIKYYREAFHDRLEAWLYLMEQEKKLIESDK